MQADRLQAVASSPIWRPRGGGLRACLPGRVARTRASRPRKRSSTRLLSSRAAKVAFQIHGPATAFMTSFDLSHRDQKRVQERTEVQRMVIATPAQAQCFGTCRGQTLVMSGLDEGSNFEDSGRIASVTLLECCFASLLMVGCASYLVGHEAVGEAILIDLVMRIEQDLDEAEHWCGASSRARDAHARADDAPATAAGSSTRCPSAHVAEGRKTGTAPSADGDRKRGIHPCAASTHPATGRAAPLPHGRLSLHRRLVVGAGRAARPRRLRRGRRRGPQSQPAPLSSCRRCCRLPR